jgi:hypothetical protein
MFGTEYTQIARTDLQPEIDPRVGQLLFAAAAGLGVVLFAFQELWFLSKVYSPVIHCSP